MSITRPDEFKAILDDERALNLISFLEARARLKSKSIIDITINFLAGSEEGEDDLLSRLPLSDEDQVLLVPWLGKYFKRGLSEYTAREHALMGIAYEFGLGGDMGFGEEINVEKAHDCYQVGAMQGDLFAASRLGCDYEAMGDTEKAIQLFDEAFQKGARLALINKGLLLGKSYEYNYEGTAAKECLAKATSDGRRGPANALLQLVKLSYGAKYKKAALQLAARTGSPAALSQLGGYYQVKEGCDYETAAHHMRFAVLNGGGSPERYNLSNLVNMGGDLDERAVTAYHAWQAFGETFVDSSSTNLIWEFKKISRETLHRLEQKDRAFEIKLEVAKQFAYTPENVWGIIEKHPKHPETAYLINKLNTKDMSFFLEEQKRSAPMFMMLKECDENACFAILHQLNKAKLFENAFAKEDFQKDKLFSHLQHLDMFTEFANPIFLANILVERQDHNGATGLDLLAKWRSDSTLLETVLHKADQTILNDAIKSNVDQFMRLDLSVRAALLPVLNQETINHLVIELTKVKEPVKKSQAKLALCDIFHSLTGEKNKLGLLSLQSLSAAFSFDMTLLKNLFSRANYATLDALLTHIPGHLLVYNNDTKFKDFSFNSALDLNLQLESTQKEELRAKCKKIKVFHLSESSEQNIKQPVSSLSVFAKAKEIKLETAVKFHTQLRR